MANIMILAQAVLQIFCSQGPLWFKCLSLKRGITQVKFHRILWKVNQVIHIMYPTARLISWSYSYFIQKAVLPYKMLKSEKGDNSAKYLQNFTKSWSGHLHLAYRLYAKYHDPSSRDSQDILLTKSFMGKHLCLKRGVIQSNIHINLWKANQVIYS